MRIPVIVGDGRATGTSKAPAEGTKASAPAYAGAEASIPPKVSNSRYFGSQLAETQVYKQFMENESFRRFVGDMVYAITSEA
jgi:hypothetical protein